MNSPTRKTMSNHAMNESLIEKGAIHSDQPPVEAYPVYPQEHPMQVFKICDENKIQHLSFSKSPINLTSFYSPHNLNFRIQ